MEKVDLDLLEPLAGIKFSGEVEEYGEFRESVLAMIAELRAARDTLEVIKEMKGGYLQCECHPEVRSFRECDYMTGSYRAFEAASRVVTKEVIK